MAFSALAFILSERKARFPIGQFFVTLALQLSIAAVFLRVPVARNSLDGLNGIVAALQEATWAGTNFLFGYLGSTQNLPFDEAVGNPGPFFIFALQALPLLVFVSALAAVLWHWGILKVIIRAFAMIIARLLGTGGAVSLAAAANVLLGQTEAPLLIRPYLRRLTRSELFAVISCGYATVAGTVMALYAFILSPLDPAMLGHILVASIIAVPAALLISRIMVPPAKGEVATTADQTADGFDYQNTMDAFTRGASEGGKLWANIIVAILAFIALAALINIILGQAPDVAGAPLTLERLLGWFFAPFVWLAGVPADQMFTAGELMGIKTALNEVIAYERLAGLAPEALDDRATLIMVYAMCGFANIGSLGIVIGGLSALEEGRRHEVIQLAPKALMAGTLATLSSGAAVGLIW
ncbi:NupC/NupG family nucleoside CNT transporter [Parvularcula sp. LCG005]|uniref:NupC/NupG family nucleoside CNT transporter n=1 Tax=Parvularcula sp. LCG005 TaxID=3078805 RepID=UPI002942D2A1|nr:nucleoside transporter C-terminal domain-containing protein [Parvularcula sp. LCG005]WOI52141.1 nucleoside transporter C-terminal domain-containing protein [Parvularcula sp. LCG005]